MSRLNWLEDQLEREDLSASQRAKYEAEAERIAISTTKLQENLRKQREEQAAKLAHIQELIASGDENSLVAQYGFEFADDYETIVEGCKHVVYSSVANDMGPSRWECNSPEDAQRRTNKLIYYRVYNKYMREST